MNPLIAKVLKNRNSKYASIVSESDSFNNKDTIDTGMPVLNIAFAGDVEGGMCSGLTLLAGPSKTFKSTLGLVCVKAYLDKYPDAICVLYDSEGGITKKSLVQRGIDPERVVHIPIEHLEMLKFDIVKQLKEIDNGAEFVSSQSIVRMEH
jgi:hypothetical protein